MYIIEKLRRFTVITWIPINFARCPKKSPPLRSTPFTRGRIYIFQVRENPGGKRAEQIYPDARFVPTLKMMPIMNGDLTHQPIMAMVIDTNEIKLHFLATCGLEARVPTNKAVGTNTAIFARAEYSHNIFRT